MNVVWWGGGGVLRAKRKEKRCSFKFIVLESGEIFFLGGGVGGGVFDFFVMDFLDWRLLLVHGKYRRDLCLGRD